MSLTRRSALGLGAALAAGSAAAQSPSFVNRKQGLHPYRVSPVEKRPHVFLISVDMISPDHHIPGRAPRAAMELPALDALAADSVVFSNAFCTSPLCAPARASLLTGRYTYITANNERAHDGHETALRASDVIFPEYLKATGYVTKHAGKGHLGAQKFFDAFDENADGWDRWDPPVRTDENYLAWLRKLGVKPHRFRKEIRGLEQDRKTPSNRLGGWVEQEDGKPFPLEAQYSYYLAERAIEKLDAALGQSAGRAPVYLQLDFFDPHQPFTIPAGFEEREKRLRAALRLPESYEEARRRDFRADPSLPRIYDLYRKYWGLYDPRTVEDYRVANALQVEVMDRAVARFIGELKRRGLYDEALIVFTADHGEMNGRRALVDKGVYLHPEVLRVPLYVKPPRSQKVKPRRHASPVTHLDLAPTLLAAAGIEPGERLDGVPLPVAADTAGDRDFLVECGWHVSANYACGIQRWRPGGEHHLYAYNLSSDTDELYDLNAADPVNLAARAESKALRVEMASKLGSVLERDPRWVGYWSSFRLDRYFELNRKAGDMQMTGRQ